MKITRNLLFKKKRMQMPGGGRYTMRSRRLWTWSAHRMTYCTDPGLVGIPFGLLFSLTGLLCLSVLPWIFLTPSTSTVWQKVLGALVVLLIGTTHLLGAPTLLWRNRTTLNRKLRTVSTRTGWLGLIVRRYPLDQFPAICVQRVKRPFFYYSWQDFIYQVSLSGNDLRTIAIAYASTEELATDLVNELRRFIKSNCLEEPSNRT